MATCQGHAPYAEDTPPTIRLIRDEFLVFPNVPQVCGETFVFSTKRKRISVTDWLKSSRNAFSHYSLGE